jgi:diguanylate cyclase (GGDEF)-like protein/PAS domain S-box-containing protein
MASTAEIDPKWGCRVKWFWPPTWLRARSPERATEHQSKLGGAATKRWSRSRRTVPPTADFVRAIVESSDDAIIGSALDGTVLSWNRAAESLYGYTATEMLGRNISALIPPNRHDDFPGLFARLGAGEHIEHYETVRRRNDGRLFDVSVTISPVRDTSGDVVGASTISRDITSRKRTERQIEHRAFHDPLTDLPNRVLLDDRIQGALARAQRRDALIAILFLDLDDFKRINDSHGHTTGDRVLKMLGPRLQAVIRPDDTLARFGGDEFVIVCTDIYSRDKAEIIADRINDALAAPFDVGGTEISVSASIGITLGAADDNPDELLGKADAAMYTAKARDQFRSTTSDVEQERPDTTADT